MSGSNRSTPRGTPVLAVLLSTLLFTPVVAEVAVRLLRPQPPVQVVRLERRGQLSRVVKGTPVWRESPFDRRNAAEACVAAHPERPTVALLGSSILYGSGLSYPESIGGHLAGQLPDHCVIVLAQPAYNFHNAELELDLWVADHGPVDQILLELWASSPHRYTVLGSTAYDLTKLAPARDGLPAGPGGSALSATAMDWSRLYELWVLRQAQPVSWPDSQLWKAWMESTLPAFLARHPDSEVVGVVAPFLDGPLAPRFQGQEREGRYEARALARDWLRDRGHGVVELGVALAQEEVTEIRLDPCCHFNERGSALVAEVLAAEVRAD